MKYPIPAFLKSIIVIHIDAVKKWIDDKALRLAAALAFYAAFSIGPMLLLLLSIASLFVSEESVRSMIINELERSMGETGVKVVEGMISSAQSKEKGVIMTLVSLGIVLFSATGLFYQLKDALNTIWGVKVKKGLSIIAIIKDRALSFTLIISIGFLMLVSLVMTALIAGFSGWIEQKLLFSSYLIQLINWSLATTLTTILFAMMYKMLPDVKVPWRSVWYAAFITAVLFSALKQGLAVYLGTGTDSTYDAPGALILVLSWVYFSSMLLIFGAELSYVISKRRNLPIRLNRFAEWEDDSPEAERIPS